jgi:hypothetical protein
VLTCVPLARSEALASGYELVQPIASPARARVRGTTGFDGLERISTQTLLDFLEVPQRERTAGAYRQLTKLMAELGWTGSSRPGLHARWLQGAGARLYPRGCAGAVARLNAATSPSHRPLPPRPKVKR